MFSSYVGHVVLQEKVMQENKQMLLRIDHMAREHERLEDDMRQLKSDLISLQREYWRNSSDFLTFSDGQ